MNPKYTKQGVRDLGHGPRKVQREIPEEGAVVCPHLQLHTDKKGITRCVDCNERVAREEFE